MSFGIGSVRVRVMIVSAVVAALAITTAVAFAGGAKGRVGAQPLNGCVVVSPGFPENRNLKLRMGQCQISEQSIDWPPVGSRGPVGPAGPTGSVGPKGPVGPQGPKGVTQSQRAVATQSGPGGQFDSSPQAVAQCPSGTALLGGGAVTPSGEAIQESQPDGDGWVGRSVKLTPGDGIVSVIVTAVCTK